MSALVFRMHALKRMGQRHISEQDVIRVLAERVTVELYPEDRPFPSCLLLGWIDNRPIHVVVADDTQNDRRVIVTVYEPDGERWEAGFQRRCPL